MVVSGVLLINEHYAIIVRNGGAQAWTDAILNLSAYMKNIPAKEVFCMDWGMLDQLRLLHRGKLPLAMGPDAASDPAAARAMISDPAHVFIAHTKEYEFFPDMNARLVKFGANAGLRTETIQLVPDTFGRPVYDVYKFVGQVSTPK